MQLPRYGLRWFIGMFELHHRIAITRLSDPIFARSVMRISVMPSTRYSCCGSPERFANARTAKD